MISVTEVNLKVVEKNRFLKIVRYCMRDFCKQCPPNAWGSMGLLLVRIFDNKKPPPMLLSKG